MVITKEVNSNLRVSDTKQWGLRDWAGARKAFIDEIPRPSLQEISDRYSIPHSSVIRIASEESWTVLRQQKQELALKSADAANLLSYALKEVHAAPGMLGEVAIKILGGVLASLDDMEASKPKPRARLDMLNTSSFILKNTADALEKAGVLSIGDLLRRGAEAAGGINGHGKWDKALLQQINVTVQGMTTANTAQKTPGPATAAGVLAEDGVVG